MKKLVIQVCLRREIVDELNIRAKERGMSRSQFIENILEEYLFMRENKKPETTKEKVIKWLLTGDDGIFK